MKRLLSTFFALCLLVTTFNSNSTIYAEETSAEWSTQNGHVATEIIEGVRYYELASTANNDNGKNSAIINRTESWKTEGTQGNATLKFMPISGAAVTRFGVNLLYSDMNNYLTVGYDAGGWFWEYKINGSGDWMKSERVSGPGAETMNLLEIELKDNKLIAFNTTDDGEKVRLFDQMFEPLIIDTLTELSKDNDNIVIRLGSYGGTNSIIRVVADDQSDITDPGETIERPSLGKYDEYQYDLDFETTDEEMLAKLFIANQEDIVTSLVDHNDSKAMKIDFTTGRNVLSFSETALLDNFEMEADLTPQQAMIRLGLVGRYNGTDMVYGSVGDKNNQYYSEFYGENSGYSSNSTGVEIEPEVTHRWKIRLVDSKITLSVDGTIIFENDMNKMPLSAGELGFFKDRGAGSVIVDNITIKRIPPVRPEKPSEEGANIETLSSGFMDVRVDKDFPRVLDYTTDDGKVMHGQTTAINKVIINGVEIEPTVSSVVTEDKITYSMDVIDFSAGISAVLESEISVENNILTFKITDVINNLEDQSTNAGIIRTIEIPNQSLVSVRSDDSNSSLMGAKMSTNTFVSGDTETKVTDELTRFSQNYMYAFVSNSELSAGLSSNSQTSANGDFNRVHAGITEYEGFNAMGLSSSQFIYHRDVMYNEHTLDLPEVKVAIAKEANHDGVVNWQDGAIAFRDIMNKPIGSEYVKELVAYRIAMNFGSHAQNPFLMTLDYIKKVNLHTDGLGQSILLKGYGSEGHDSGHLNYADIGTRMGGVDEFVDLLNQSVDYGARIGIHVNASETYPESKYFTEDLLRKNADGTYNYGWNWIDQGININAAYDLANGRRNRFEDLKELVGENLDWIYVDVWGNGQSGDNGSWASHQLAKEIHDQGWRLGGEWGYAFEPDSTFQHWATDLTYGGYSLKGINSNVTRFIFNAYRDSWNAHYPSYSGSADYPLLGGYNMKDFEGWQGRNDYDGYMVNLFENNVPTKFVQHFDATRWVEGDPVRMPNPAGGTGMWTPEMEIELEGDLGTLIIKRKSNDYANDLANYRSRTMTLNDRLVYDGDAYLLPWSWDAIGNDLETSEERLYHFNKDGGTTTWNVPSDWNVSNVAFYELTETGRVLVDTVDVVNGTITLDAKSDTAYTVYRGEQAPMHVTYGNGAHIVDPHFNFQNLDAWNVTGDNASIIKSQATNDMLMIRDNNSETRVSQTLSDLTPGKRYVAYVGVDNRSDSKASLTISHSNKEFTNYTNKSIAKNYVKAYGHNTNSSTVDNNSYFQNVFVYFTAPLDGSDVTLTLHRDSGQGATYFDDVRITENSGNPYISPNVYLQDFEGSAQGLAPFVVGNIEGVEDNRSHLSELNAPYTQRGWNNKQISDVIEGNWSVKTNGLTQRNRLVYQTIPQNVRFEPGVTYKLTFDYEAGSEGTYALVVGDGEINGSEEKLPISSTLDHDSYQTYEIEITGAESGQTWFGIYSTNVAADTKDSTDKDANFRSYKDIMLDNIRVERVSDVIEETVDTSNLEILLEMIGSINAEDYTEESWNVLQLAVADAKAFLATEGITQTDVENQYDLLFAAYTQLVTHVKQADTIALTAALVRARSIKQEEYTDASVKPLNAAIEEAESLMDRMSAQMRARATSVTQEEVDEAVSNLNTAIGGLVRKDTDTTTPPTKPDVNVTESEKPGNSDDLPSTGMASDNSLLIIGFALLLGGGGLYVYTKKKKHNENQL